MDGRIDGRANNNESAPTVNATSYYSALTVGNDHFTYVDLNKVLPADVLVTLPYSMRLLIENVARRSP